MSARRLAYPGPPLTVKARCELVPDNQWVRWRCSAPAPGLPSPVVEVYGRTPAEAMDVFCREWRDRHEMAAAVDLIDLIDEQDE